MRYKVCLPTFRAVPWISKRICQEEGRDTEIEYYIDATVRQTSSQSQRQYCQDCNWRKTHPGRHINRRACWCSHCIPRRLLSYTEKEPFPARWNSSFISVFLRVYGENGERKVCWDMADHPETSQSGIAFSIREDSRLPTFRAVPWISKRICQEEGAEKRRCHRLYVATVRQTSSQSQRQYCQDFPHAGKGVKAAVWLRGGNRSETQGTGGAYGCRRYGILYEHRKGQATDVRKRQRDGSSDGNCREAFPKVSEQSCWRHTSSEWSGWTDFLFSLNRYRDLASLFLRYHQHVLQEIESLLPPSAAEVSPGSFLPRHFHCLRSGVLDGRWKQRSLCSRLGSCLVN